MESEVSHQLALKTKRQGDTLDYRVLTCSEGMLSVEDFEEVFNRLSVGTMPSKAMYKGESPPWVTFGSLKLNGVTYVASIRQEWTDRTDVRGRPVAAMCCISFPYKELSSTSSTYTTLFNRIPALKSFLHADNRLTTDDVPFSIPEEQWENVASIIDDLGFEYCASIAAISIQTPVALVKGTDLSVTARLSYLDAILSLLPYGARASLSTSTWMHSSSSVYMRLGFTDQARQEQQRVAWGEIPQKTLLPDSGSKEYFLLLNNIRERRSTLDIVKSLAKQISPVAFGNPDVFINALRATDRLNLLWQDLKTGQIAADEVRRAFGENGIADLSEDKRFDLLNTLIPNLEPQDISILRRHWLSKLTPPLCNAISSALQNPNIQCEALYSLSLLAEEKKWLVPYLKALLQPIPDSISPNSDSMVLVFRGLQKLDESNSIDDAEYIREKLTRHRQLLFEFAFQVLYRSSDENELKFWFKWLAGKDPTVKNDLDAFASAAGLIKKTVSLEQLRIIGEVPGSFVLRLVSTAANVSSKIDDIAVLERLVPAASVWLLERIDTIDDKEVEEWRKLLPFIKGVPIKTELGDARVDILSLVLYPENGELLLETYLRGPQNEFRNYSRKFTGLFSCLGGKKNTAVEYLMTHCLAWDLKLDEENINLLQLYGDLIPYVQGDSAQAKLAESIEKVVEESPELLSHETFTSRLRNYLINMKRSSGLFKALESKLKKSLSSNKPVREVAEIAADLLNTHEIDKELRVLKILDQQNYLANPEQIEDFVCELQRQLEQRSKYSYEARERTTYFHKALLKHDSSAIHLYRQYLGGCLINELRKIEILAELVGEDMNETQAGEVSMQLDKIYGRLKKDGFFKNLNFWSTRKR